MNKLDALNALVDRLGQKLASDGESGREALEELATTGDCSAMDPQFVEIFHMWAFLLGVSLAELCTKLSDRASLED